MIHIYIGDNSTGEHYAVAKAAIPEGKVLVQIQDQQGDQVRVALTPEQAMDLCRRIRYAISDVEYEKGKGSYE
jgi:hypothetical protein